MTIVPNSLPVTLTTPNTLTGATSKVGTTYAYTFSITLNDPIPASGLL